MSDPVVTGARAIGSRVTGAGASDSPAGDGPGGSPPSDSPPRVLVLAADLTWGTRLAAQLRIAGAEAETVPSASALAARLAIGGLTGAVVDLSALGYDGVAAVADIVAAGVPALAVGQHDDAELRRRAVAAGATRFLSYRAMFERGPEILASWLGTPAPTRADGPSSVPPPPMESRR